MSNSSKDCEIYSLDIHNRENHPFINIRVENERCLVSAYEGGKITRSLFYMDERELKLFVNGLQSAKVLMKKNEQ